MTRALPLLALLLLAARQENRQQKVLGDRDKIKRDGFWIYNDVQAGVDEAKKTGKPLLVVFRCIPCAACVQIDSEVADRDPAVKPLLEKFVCVRVVYTNGMDLSLFQFDYDQSWAAFMLNADRTIYGRYGTRSHQTREDEDISIAGFSAALEGALELHAKFPQVRDALQAKRGPPAPVAAPEKFPSFKGKYNETPDWEGKVVQSCIHCHMVGEAFRKEPRAAGKAPADDVLYPFPHPKILGLVLDPTKRAVVKDVAAGSAAAVDGFQPGDELVSLEGQPLLSIADVQWVLHRAGPSGALKARVKRAGKDVDLPLTLKAGWRQGDLSWRATSWDLRRMVAGGLKLVELNAEKRKALGLDATSLALRVEHVGQYGEHAVAKKAGFQRDDVLVSVAGQSKALSEGALHVQLLNATKPGETVPVTVLRDGKRLDFKLPMQ